MTSGTALRESLTVPGRPEHVHDVRQFVIRTMGAGHPCTDLAVLLSSEVATNSITHSGSGLPGGTITVTVASTAGGFRVEVLDVGGASVPHVKALLGALTEGGRGLCLVSELSACWGYRHEGAGVVTWFEVVAEPEPATESHPSGTAPRQTAGSVTSPRTFTSCEGARS
jgi:anti-sigma regulatory factor (Ser/Thr protein kinase)